MITNMYNVPAMNNAGTFNQISDQQQQQQQMIMNFAYWNNNNLFQQVVPADHMYPITNFQAINNNNISETFNWINDQQEQERLYEMSWIQKQLEIDSSVDELLLFSESGFVDQRGVAVQQQGLFHGGSTKSAKWSVHEHKLFLSGVRQKEWGDWRGISREVMTTKTAAQIASHAQKYQLRYYTPQKDKKRSSIHDITFSLEGLPVVPPSNFNPNKKGN